jgi:nickel transport protein
VTVRPLLTALVAALGTALLAGAAAAHDIWITTVGPAAARRAVINYGHPDDRQPTVTDKIIDIFAYGANERRSLIAGLATARKNGFLVVETQPFRDPGGLLLAVRYDNGFWVKTADGYRNATTREVPDARDSLWSMKFGKALTGPKAPWGKVLGHTLELVPLADPTRVAPGRVLRLRVLFRGEPLVGAEVERGDGLTRVAEERMARFTTDADGIATIPIARTGPTQLTVEHTVAPSATAALAGRDLFAATLWYRAPAR